MVSCNFPGRFQEAIQHLTWINKYCKILLCGLALVPCAHLRVEHATTWNFVRLLAHFIYLGTLITVLKHNQFLLVHYFQNQSEVMILCSKYWWKPEYQNLCFSGKFGLWLDGDLYQGRTEPCNTYGNDPLTPSVDFVVKTLECWAFI